MNPYLQEILHNITTRLAALENAKENEPVGYIYEDDEGRIMFSQMPTSAFFLEPVYRGKREKNANPS